MRGIALVSIHWSPRGKSRLLKRGAHVERVALVGGRRLLRKDQSVHVRRRVELVAEAQSPNASSVSYEQADEVE